LCLDCLDAYPDGTPRLRLPASKNYSERSVTPTAPGGADDEIYAMALQHPSKLIASGECDQPATGRDVCVVRYELNP
jgi:hypothetical protein